MKATLLNALDRFCRAVAVRLQWTLDMVLLAVGMFGGLLLGAL